MKQNNFFGELFEKLLKSVIVKRKVYNNDNN